ncbi:MAG: methyltransferase domain-containing protein [Thermoanaerobaculia bacterium]|nr:methyltransferase domain-containing protein [Thermoanaerobaculia bacterium]
MGARAYRLAPRARRGRAILPGMVRAPFAAGRQPPSDRPAPRALRSPARRLAAWLRRWREGDRPAAWSSARVARYYDEWHERYLAAFGDTFQSQRTADLGALLAHVADQAELAPGRRVLDAGCGVAGPALWLARHRGVEVEALTISPAQAAEARRRVAAAGLGERVRVTLGDFHRLEAHYPEASFDAVLFLESLVHSDHPRRVLAAAHRVLRPGGVLYVKDLFQRARIPDRAERARVRRVIANVNREFCLNVKAQRPFLAALRRAGFDLEWLRAPPLATQHDLGNAFVAAHAIDIYEGPPVTFLDWLELKARRPGRP